MNEYKIRKNVSSGQIYETRHYEYVLYDLVNLHYTKPQSKSTNAMNTLSWTEAQPKYMTTTKLYSSFTGPRHSIPRTVQFIQIHEAILSDGLGGRRQ